jgi:hypothetical protein
MHTVWSSFLKCPSTSCLFPISEDKELAANRKNQTWFTNLKLQLHAISISTRLESPRGTI